MTYQPPFYPQQPQPPYGVGLPYYDGTMRPPRPTSVTTLGVIGIVLASIGILNNAGGIALYAWAMSRPTLPAFLKGQDGQIGAINVAGSAISLCLALYLMSAAIAALRLRPWGRTELRRYAVVYLVWLAVWMVLAYGWVMPATVEVQKEATPGGALPPGTEVGMYLGATFMFGVMCVYPIFLLIWMGKRHVRAAFNGEWPTQPAAYPQAAAPLSPGAGWPAPGHIPPPGGYPPPGQR